MNAKRLALALRHELWTSVTPRSTVSVYVVAVLFLAAAVLLSWLLDPVLGNTRPIATLVGAVAATVWLGGYRPAILVGLLGYVACASLFIDSPGGFGLEGDGLARLLSYSATCAIVIAFGEATRRARQRAEVGREFLRVTLASVGDAIITTDTGGRVVGMNPLAELLTGWAQDDARGLPLETVFQGVDEETRERRPNPVVAALAKGAAVDPVGPTIVVAKDGTERPIDERAAPIRDAGDRVLGCVVIFHDVSERRRIESELRENEERHRQQAENRLRASEHLVSRLVGSNDLVSGLNDILDAGIELIGADMGHLQLLNPKTGKLELCAHRGFGPEFLEHYREVGAEHGSVCGRALRAGQRVVVEDVQADPEFSALLRTSGDVASRGVQSTPLFGHAGEILGMISTHHLRPHRPITRDLRVLDLYARQAADFIERIRVTETLRDAARRKDEFLAMLAHELRNPLAPVRNSLELLKRADGDAELIHQARITMDRQLAQLVRLVDDLLDVNRITRDKLELRRERVELASIVRHAVESCEPIARRAHHELSLSVPSDPIPLDADPVRLAQVFSNILNNACKYSEPGSRIALVVENGGGHVTVRVKDSGMGIPADKLGTIFDMFTQIDRTLERSQGGLGIGLTLAKRLVELHGGTIEATSAGEGKGSEFIVRLPVAAGPRDPVAPGPVAEPTTLGHRILIVDDNADAAASLAMLLKITGNHTCIAGDGLEAVRAAEAFQPDIVLLDIGLPKLNGFDACRRIREQEWGRRMRIVALTGWGQEADRRQSHEAGFDAHMVKPVDYHDLLNAMTAMDQARSGRYLVE